MEYDEMIFADHSWSARAGGKMLTYVGPHLKQTLNRDTVKQMVYQKKAMGAVWNYDWSCSEGPWYSYVCDTPDYDVKVIKSKNSRKTIRRSLERCDTRKIEMEWLAENSYEVYRKAVEGYENWQITSESDFKKHILQISRLPGVFAYGAFVDKNLAAYGIAFEIGKSILFAAAKFAPEYSHAKPMVALYYTLAHDCLNNGFTDIDAGWKPFFHTTNIEEFFRRMGWRQAPCRIDIYLKPSLEVALFMSKIFKLPLKLVLPDRYYAMLSSLLTVREIAKKSKK